jgi:uncharacterized membrane protein YdjX (TVP38/TMEM64 family)
MQVLVAVIGLLPASLLGVGVGAFYDLVPGFLLSAASTFARVLFSFFLSRSRLYQPKTVILLEERMFS